MKFLHIADLHIGKKLNDINLLEDQVFALEQIVNAAASNSVDGVFIAGDIYDKPSPQSEAMAVFDDFITKLCQKGIKIFAISGNHDSRQRISYFSGILKNSGVYFSENFNGKLQQITINDEYGEFVINLLPFIKPFNIKKYYPSEDIRTYEDAVKIVLENSQIDEKKRNILLCHQFITGAEVCDSEELAVGGLDNINAAVFDKFDYVALGHIHKPQKIGRETLRYSGSLLKYSFSEANHKKSFVLGEIKQKGDIEISKIPIELKHEVREISGTMDEIMNMKYSEDYVKITLFDEFLSPDARVTVSTVFPNMMSFSVKNSKTKEDILVTDGKSIENKTTTELFADFYSLQNNGVMPCKQHIDIVDEILKELEEEHYEAD